jgi:hypothetical protein
MHDSPWMPPPGADGNRAAAPPPPPPPAPAGGGTPAPPPPGAGSDPFAAPTLPNADQAAPSLPNLPPASPPSPTITHVAPPPFATGGALVDGPPPNAAPAGRSGRSKAVVAGAVVGLLAVGGAGVFAVSSFTGGSDGGAADPDALGASLMTAFENEDVLGMIDVLAPGERDLFRQPSIDFVSELARLEVLSSDADLSAIAGLDLVLDNEQVVVDGTNVDDIVNVRMRADAEITIDGAAFPVGDLITDNMDADMLDEMRSTTETTEERIDIELTAVQLDGRWYFSLFHTLAELARAEAAPDTDIPLEGIGARGAESPDAAVNQLFDSIEQLDLELLLQSLNPGEAAALQRYAPLFLDDAEAVLDEVPLEWRITTRGFRVEGDGPQRTVFVDAIGIEGDLEGTPFTLAVDGDCVSASLDGETFEQCATETDGQQQELLDEILSELPEVGDFLDVVQESFLDIEPIGLELREFEGAWYVSPVSTMTEAGLAFLRALDRDELDRMIESGTAVADEAIELGGDLADIGAGTGDIAGDDLFTDDVFTDDVFTDDTFAEETFVDDTFDDGTGATATGWEACYGESDPATAAGCFDSYVQSGEIEPIMVPVELRFPECGLSQRWSSELYGLPDAEFIAVLEAAAPCFQSLVDTGQITEFEVPAEITNLACFEGRNWFNTFDDPEYDERYWDCVDAIYAG